MIDRPRRGRALRTVAIGLVPVATAAAVAAALPGPIVIQNPSPSIPQGYYLRTGEAPATGRIIAFRIPDQGRPYAAEHMPPLIRAGIIKRIAAQAGDTVCTTGAEGLSINGRHVAPIVANDRLGRPLPHWRGCRALEKGEFFVYSGRIPNSYDSRYYGPVRSTDIIGTFRPLWTTGESDQAHPSAA